jgi:hypothetical protein
MATMLVSAARQVRQFICGLHGHDALLHFDQSHVSLLCVVCGHESPGWNVPGAASSSRADDRGHMRHRFLTAGAHSAKVVNPASVPRHTNPAAA